MRWPLVWRSTHEAVVAGLKLQVVAAESRARRRAKRHADAEIKARETAAVRDAIAATDTAAAFADTAPDLPPEIVEAIEARAPNARIRAQMTSVALKAVADGEPTDRIAAYMWAGESE